MALQIKRATRSENKLRMALIGPSGSGKTYTALRVLFNLLGETGKILLVDTERGSGSLYAGEAPDGYAWVYDVIELPDFAPETYIEAIEIAQQAGYEGIIIDSLSHAWMGINGLLEQVDKIAKVKKYQSSFAAWKDVAPRERMLWDAVLSCGMHMVATMRTKTEYGTEEYQVNGKTKTRPVKIGLAPIQRGDIEYEFTFFGTMTMDQEMVIDKTRCSRLRNTVWKEPGAEVAAIIRDWLGSADASAEPMGDNAPSDNSEKKKGVRPYAPETVKAGLESRAQKGSGVAPTKGLLGAMNGALEMLFGDKPAEQRPVLRRQLLSWWPGVNSSSGLTDGQVRAYLAWAQDQTADGAYVPNDYAIQEAAKIIEALEHEQEQQRLVLI
jgi:hypothetical protein